MYTEGSGRQSRPHILYGFLMNGTNVGPRPGSQVPESDSGPGRLHPTASRLTSFIDLLIAGQTIKCCLITQYICVENPSLRSVTRFFRLRWRRYSPGNVSRELRCNSMDIVRQCASSVEEPTKEATRETR